MQRIVLVSSFCIAVALYSVGAGADPVEQEPSAQLAGHMREHFDAVTRIREAIERGELAALREPAQWLLDHPAPRERKVGWNPYLKAMRAAASAVLEANSFMAASTAASQMAVACGDCHIANNASVRFSPVSEPGEESESLVHMHRHKWAADRMWEGLIGPSAQAWNEGADILFEAPLAAEEMAIGEEVPNIRRMERRIHQLAANATVQYEAAGQARIYAEFLATCASCHTILDQGPVE